MSDPHAPSAAGLAAQTWAKLAPMLAARPTVRLWSAADGFSIRTRLSTRLPAAPAAVALFSRHRTRLLAFDLDAKRGDRDAVSADREQIVTWLTACGAQFLSDRSTSGGVHILVPLARAATVDTIGPLMRAAARQCPTLDISPMLHPKQGAITVPGSVCREGGYRILDGDLDAAVDVVRTRNPVHLLADLTQLLVSPDDSVAEYPLVLPHDPAGFFDGDGPEARLAPQYRRHDPLPATALRFAETGRLSPHHRSPSEGRQSVLVHAMWRGWSLSDIHSHISTGGPWANGLGNAYSKYGSRVLTSLHADWAAARTFVLTAVQKVQASEHKNQVHTRGVGNYTRTGPHRRWLTDAIWWCDIVLRSHPARWTVAAVLQALAVASARSGAVINGVPSVGVGGRSLSVGAGLISESAVWAALRMLRDMPGSPLLLVSVGTGVKADSYALVTPDVRDPDPQAAGRPTLSDVHPVWSAIGLRYRRIYEVIENSPDLTVAETAAAARMSRSGAFDAIAELARVGLVSRRKGRVSTTQLTLDVLGEQLSIGEYRAERIAAHQKARKRWREWLAHREDPVVAPRDPRPLRVQLPTWGPLSAADHDDCLVTLMANGPPALV